MELSQNTTALHHATSVIRPRNKNYSWSWKAVNINLQIILKLRILTSLVCSISLYCYGGFNAIQYSSFSILVYCKSGDRYLCTLPHNRTSHRPCWCRVNSVLIHLECAGLWAVLIKISVTLSRQILCQDFTSKTVTILHSCHTCAIHNNFPFHLLLCNFCI